MSLDPYAAVPEFYDAEFDDATADADAFARRGVPGPVAVLGCGTGRITRVLERTRPVVGLDRSGPMLARARARGGATRYVQGDLTSFRPEEIGAVREIILPNAALAFLPDRRSQLRCLEACHRALPPGAPLTVDLPFPDFALLGTPHTPERLAWEGDVGARRVRRTREVFRAPAAQSLRLLDRFYEGDLLVAVSELVLALVFPRELEWLAEAAGFYVEALWGDHRDGPVREGCPRLVGYLVRV